MRTILYVTLFLFLSHCGSKKDTNTTSGVSHQVSDSFIEGKNSVTKKSSYYKSGLVVGTFLKASERGWIFDTKEVQISKGNFPGTSYIGQLSNMSINGNNESIYNQLLQLNPQQVYVFEYRVPHDWNPEIEDTHFHILSATPLNKEFGMNYKGVVKASEKTGGYSAGERRGKIIIVERWGFFFDLDCSLTLHVGGRGGSQVFPIFNVYSEEGCRFAEEALKAGKDVIVKYSEDHIEWWDEHKKIAEEIILVN